MTAFFSFVRRSALAGAAVAMTTLTPVDASAAETEAHGLLLAMSDYMASLDSFAFDFDATHEVVTTDGQKLALARSGRVLLRRPDGLHAFRIGGFETLELRYDGATLSLSAPLHGIRTEIEAPATLDAMIDALRNEHGVPLPAADLLGNNPYSALMESTFDVKDLGVGVIGGIECDHLAFRTADVDWQIWIARGDAPHPCRFAIASPQVAEHPQYVVEIREWRAGVDVQDSDFAPVVSSPLELVSPDLFAERFAHYPDHFRLGDDQ